MTLKEKIQQESGQREYDTGYTCPVLGPVIIQTLSEAEFQDSVLLWSVNQKFERIEERRKFENARLVQMSLVDENHNRIYSDDDKETATIAGLRRRVFQPLYERCLAWQRPDTPKNS